MELEEARKSARENAGKVEDLQSQVDLIISLLPTYVLYSIRSKVALAYHTNPCGFEMGC